MDRGQGTEVEDTGGGGAQAEKALSRCCQSVLTWQSASVGGEAMDLGAGPKPP